MFYDTITPPSLSPDERAVMRQALAGMLWSKQYYFFDLDAWPRATAPIRCSACPLPAPGTPTGSTW